jgi:putative membrane protein
VIVAVKTHPNILLLAAVAPVVAWSAWRPYDRLTWWMEVMPVFLGLIALFIAGRNGWRFSGFVLVWIALHMVVLVIGGHYTYARVPAGDWVSEALGWQRNHYDRLGHIMQGLVPALVCREIFLRIRVIAHRGWLAFCVVCVALAISATYELIEWAAALISAEAAESFLGTQGDGWDTQWDMFLALLGALFAVLVLARVHDRSIRRLERTATVG